MGTNLRHSVCKYLTAPLPSSQPGLAADGDRGVTLGVARAGLGRGAERRNGARTGVTYDYLTPGKCFNHGVALGTL